MPVKALRMPVARKLQRHSWQNPTKLLRELHAKRREERLLCLGPAIALIAGTHEFVQPTREYA